MSGKFITKELLDESLIDNIHFKDKKIEWDSLSPDIVNMIKSNTSTPGSYNDNELRNRIIDLENGNIKTGNVFNKNIDKVNVSLLDSNLNNSYNESLKVKNKADISYVDNTFRKKSVPIIENDFDNNLQTKVNTIASNVTNIQGDYKYNATMVNDINTLKANVSSLNKDKMNVVDANNIFRRKDIAIQASDLESSIGNAISKINTISSSINSCVTTTDLLAYRRKDTKIGENDMDSSLLKIIKDSKAAAEGAESQIENVYQSKIQAKERQWISGVYGQLNAPSITENPNNDYKLKYITPYSFQHNAVVYCGTLTTTGDYSMAYALSWLYETVMHGTNNWYDAGNIKSIYGMSTLKNKIDQLITDVASLKTDVAGLKTDVADLKTDIADLKTDVADLKTDIASLKTDVAGLKTGV